MAELLWQPSPQRIASTNITRFMQSVAAHHGLELNSYHDLYQWSVDQPANFWSEVWDFHGVVSSIKGDEVLIDGDKMPGARWFPQARLNFAENLLKRRDDHIALVARNEHGDRLQFTFAELYQQVAQLASALRQAGVGEGDRVAGFVPNCAETVIAMLATTSLGAVWTSCSPDFGQQGVLDRFGQTLPKVLFTTDGYYYNNKAHSSLERIQQVTAALPDIEKVVVIPYLTATPDISLLGNAVLLPDFVDSSATEIDFVQVSFDAPLYILYSSGTTGAPKCIVHSVGGTLLQHLKEHSLHTDLTPDDSLMYYTTCGWMMWNWLVSGLAQGATVVLFDGSPFAPSANVLWDVIVEEGVTIFGTSAKYIAALEKADVKPGSSHDLSKLKALLSTGSTLSHESFQYVYREIKQDLCLSSISGGTDIVSCFALGCPILPVYEGELQCRGLGMAVEIYNDDGQPVQGEKGELVCVKPFPSMPIGFWNDTDGSKYHSAYFADFDNKWAHGDYAELTENLGLIIHGRSDAVLNPGGVRIGTAEIYRQVEKVEAVQESLAIGQNWEDDVRVVLFVRLKPGFTLDADLEKAIRTVIRTNTTPRHVPAKIIQVADIPRTISGKIVELAVRNVVEGKPVKNKDALANPEALDLFKDLPQLQS